MAVFQAGGTTEDINSGFVGSVLGASVAGGVPSAGGVVAFEMARQLRAAGQQVAILALLDTRIDNGNQSGIVASKTRA